MIQAITLGLLAGLMIGNGVPHFIKGIAAERYPNVLGSGPVTNVVSGWAALGIGVLFLLAADIPAEPVAGGVSIAVGVLAMGVFHAAGLAVGAARHRDREADLPGR